jgi:hypothetical protein
MLPGVLRAFGVSARLGPNQTAGSAGGRPPDVADLDQAPMAVSRAPDCPRRTFTEALPQIPPRSRLTGRLRVSAVTAVADGGRTVLQSARDHEISWPIAQAAFAAAAGAALPRQTPAVEHLGIDETRRGKAKFRLPGPDGGEVWEVLADRWHVGMVDLRDQATPLFTPQSCNRVP